MSKSSLSDKHDFDEKGVHAIAEAREVDEAARFAFEGVVDTTEGQRIRRKIDWHILPLMCILYWVQYMDKTTLGNSAVLGLKTATHLNNVQYNWLGTIFYLSYLLFEYPQSLALQRYPVGKWMSINITIWSVALLCHAACKNFGSLFAVRFVLGICEGSITAGFLIVSAMFYTRNEQTLRVGYWFLMNGTAQIVSGFISFGSLYIHTPGLEPWQWLYIITGIITLFTAIAYWFLFPDSPANAWFLTKVEKALAVSRIKENQAGVENKNFKKEQMVECLLDPKTWIFALFSCLDNIPNSLTNQSSLIIQSFGFTTLQTTLLSCVSGVIEVVTIWTGVNIAARWKNGLAYTGTIYFIPNILGSILVSALPWSNRAGLLASVYITGVGTTGFVLSLAWVNQTTAGHTKRITTNAIMLIAYCVGNAVGPQMWLAQYEPRYRVPWGVILACYTICPILLLLQRYILNKENKKRDAELPDNQYDDVWVKVADADGTTVEKKVDVAFLDLTDKQNRAFRYPL